jgi:oxygen-independent coproporphyrinogen-3 oxidase
MKLDLAVQAERIGPRRLVSIFFGGGTPSLMDPDAVADLIGEARRLFPPSDDVEIALEANPTDAEASRFAALAGAGVERLSLGVQSLDDKALAFLGRNHGAAEARRAIETAGAAFARVSVDLIYARPQQTVAEWTRELREAASSGVGHISPYQLTIEPGTAFDRARSRGRLVTPDETTAAALYDATQETLSDLGFDAYEVSNHARDATQRSRHNLAVWRGGEYLGVGPGAHGRVIVGTQRRAPRGARALGDYVERVSRAGVGLDVDEALSPREIAEEAAMLGLRRAEGAPFEGLAPLGLGPDDARVRDLEDAGLIRVADGRLAATAAGRRVLDALVRTLLV